MLVSYIALFAIGFIVFPPSGRLGPLLAYIAALTVVFLAICWRKGEPPRWR